MYERLFVCFHLQFCGEYTSRSPAASILKRFMASRALGLTRLLLLVDIELHLLFFLLSFGSLIFLPLGPLICRLVLCNFCRRAQGYPPGAFCYLFLLFLLKIRLRNSITFIAAKKTISISSVSTGFTGANVASSIIGKPNTMAGKF